MVYVYYTMASLQDRRYGPNRVVHLVLKDTLHVGIKAILLGTFLKFGPLGTLGVQLHVWQSKISNLAGGAQRASDLDRADSARKEVREYISPNTIGANLESQVAKKYPNVAQNYRPRAFPLDD